MVRHAIRRRGDCFVRPAAGCCRCQPVSQLRPLHRDLRRRQLHDDRRDFGQRNRRPHSRGYENAPPRQRTAGGRGVVLDRPLPLGFTTSFIFDTGGQPQVVEYTYLTLGSCCPPDGSCLESDEGGCAALGGTFHPRPVAWLHRLVALPTALANTSIRSVASIWVGGPSAPTRSVKGIGIPTARRRTVRRRLPRRSPKNDPRRLRLRESRHRQ